MTASGFLVALSVAVAVAFTAWRTGALSLSGAFGAVILGTATFAVGGVAWAMPLLVAFSSSSALAWLGARGPIVAARPHRNLVQVTANGGMPLVAVILHAWWPDPRWYALFVGCFAVVTADTWAGELGARYGGQPRSLPLLRPLPVGASGGTTLVGHAASIVGAALVATAAWQLDVSGRLAVVGGGVAGALLDSLLGAWPQARWRCTACGATSEIRHHCPGAGRQRIHGLAWCDNDAVNAITVTSGGILAMALGAP